VCVTPFIVAYRYPSAWHSFCSGDILLSANPLAFILPGTFSHTVHDLRCDLFVTSITRLFFLFQFTVIDRHKKMVPRPRRDRDWRSRMPINFQVPHHFGTKRIRVQNDIPGT
jgi:hypothetical protein